MTDFYIDDYITDNCDKSPEMVVIDYIHAFTKWSKHCQYWLKSYDHDIDKLTQAGAYDVLIALRKTYCTPKNRAYHRTRISHYYINGASKVNATIDEIVYTNPHEAIVYTCPEKLKKIKRHRFILKKQGKSWKIDTFYCENGHANWYESM